MLEEKDIQAIGTLLDQKLKENNQALMTEISSEIEEKLSLQKTEIFGEMDKRFDEVLSMINDAFTNHEKRFDKLESEIEKRPTKSEMFGWADDKFVDLELAKDRHDFIHIDELDKLPAPIDISKALVERGFKHKQTVKAQ